MDATLSALTISAVAALTPDAAIRTERVTFSSEGTTIVGTLYLPPALPSGRRVPGIVVTGAWMTIKEQMAGHYARALASRGFVALAFDFRTWGESGGSQRSMEDPQAKIADIEAAIRWLATRPEVSQVGGLGICASSGYLVHAAANGAPVQSVALVAPWLHDAAIVRAVYGGETGVATLMASARQAREAWTRSGTLTLRPAAGPTGANAVMAGVPYYTEPERGAIPAWENTFNVASWERWLTFDAMPAAERLKAPFLMVHSDAAAIPDGARRFFEAVRGAKAQLWLDGVAQFDFYDQPAPVARAADAVAEHFRRTLGDGVSR